ncbi:DUF4278 domain-containing protein [Oculatella sp. LEGE 06141]|uniref:DUF4278 domain-containing protein n=1 Tax=Oculatella sp. LEGE 06141 TaxID=1828648 RepID=UPI0018802C04|nr:DUF4278 domain-containing protein [Oculatella sp. LEGE 06141]MBE9179082.1 DUF4278 domain-containing protein [Oculatella sp. LEGE 06141]
MDTLVPLVNSLALAILLLGVIVGLFLAPWQILLLLLLLGLLLARRLMPSSSALVENAAPDGSSRSEPIAQSPQPSASPQVSVERPPAPSQPTSSVSMMVYRGARYRLPQKSEAIVEAPTVERTGKYRGSVCKIASRQPHPSAEPHELN